MVARAPRTPALLACNGSHASSYFLRATAVIVYVCMCVFEDDTRKITEKQRCNWFPVGKPVVGRYCEGFSVDLGSFNRFTATSSHIAYSLGIPAAIAAAHPGSGNSPRQRQLTQAAGARPGSGSSPGQRQRPPNASFGSQKHPPRMQSDSRGTTSAHTYRRTAFSLFYVPLFQLATPVGFQVSHIPRGKPCSM